MDSDWMGLGPLLEIKMSYKHRIATLEDACRNLQGQISHTEKTEPDNKKKLIDLRERHENFMAEIRKLRRVEWEETRERVDFDDDR